MNNDLKATVTGFVTSLAGILAYLNIVIPESWLAPIGIVGFLALSFFANKKDKTKE